MCCWLLTLHSWQHSDFCLKKAYLTHDFSTWHSLSCSGTPDSTAALSLGPIQTAKSPRRRTKIHKTMALVSKTRLETRKQCIALFNLCWEMCCPSNSDILPQILCTSVNNHESIAGIDLRVTNKLWKFTSTKSTKIKINYIVRNKDQQILSGKSTEVRFTKFIEWTKKRKDLTQKRSKSLGGWWRKVPGW